MCVTKSNGKCLGLAFASPELDDSIVNKVEATLKKERFRLVYSLFTSKAVNAVNSYNSNVLMPRLIRLVKQYDMPSTGTLSDWGFVKRGNDTVFRFDDASDHYTTELCDISVGAEDSNIYYGLPCNNKNINDLPRIWLVIISDYLLGTLILVNLRYHAACLNAKRNVPLRHSGSMVHDCEYCSEQLHITTLSSTDFTFIDGPWTGVRPRNNTAA